MSDQQPYTPTTEEIEATLQLGFAVTAQQQGVDPIAASEQALQGFHRWLAAHEDYVIRKWTGENDVVPHKRYTQDIAAANQRGAVKALREAADMKLGNEYYEILVEDELNDRADRLEGVDEG